MEKDRDQLTPDEPEDRARLQRHRGQGTGGTGYDRLPGEEAPANLGEDARPQQDRSGGSDVP
jgi:hypothetical protein